MNVITCSKCFRQPCKCGYLGPIKNINNSTFGFVPGIHKNGCNASYGSISKMEDELVRD